jgi:acetolactate synthase regulatory subunit
MKIIDKTKIEIKDEALRKIIREKLFSGFTICIINSNKHQQSKIVSESVLIVDTRAAQVGMALDLGISWVFERLVSVKSLVPSSDTSNPKGHSQDWD